MITNHDHAGPGHQSSVSGATCVHAISELDTVAVQPELLSQLLAGEGECGLSIR